MCSERYSPFNSLLLYLELVCRKNAQEQRGGFQNIFVHTSRNFEPTEPVSRYRVRAARMLAAAAVGRVCTLLFPFLFLDDGGPLSTPSLSTGLQREEDRL